MWQWLRSWFGKPSRQSVVSELQRRLTGLGAQDIEYDQALEEIRFKLRGSSMSMATANVYFDVLHAPRAGRKAVMDRFLAGVAVNLEDVIPDRYSDARARLFPIVRTLADDAMTQLMYERHGDAQASASGQMVSRPLAADLVAALAFDTPHATQRISERKLSQWGVSFDQVMGDALQNLRALPEHGAWKDLGVGLWSGEWGDSYEPSRILLPDLIHRLNLPDPVVMVPLRFTLLVTSARNESGLAAMAVQAKKLIAEHTRWLSLQPIVLTDAGWQAFEPPNGCRAAFDELRLIDLVETYNGQKSYIDSILEKAGEDVFVAKATLLQRHAEAAIQSYSVWSEGVDAMLPQTELVVFYRQDRKKDDPLIHVPWRAVEEIVGDLMVQTKHYPPRYRVREFPDASQWQRLMAISTSQ